MNDDLKKTNAEESLEEALNELEQEGGKKAGRADAGFDADAAQAQEGDAEDDVVFDEESELGPAEALKRLRAKLKTAVEEKQAYLNGWQRDKAEFVNARRRDEESKADFLKFAKQAVIEDLLPVFDSFDTAMSNKASWESVSEEWRKGIEGIYGQLSGILAKQGVTGFGAIGDAFDPNLHQSISVVSTDDKSKEGAVAEVLQKGYMLSGKVIRPAMVRVFEA